MDNYKCILFDIDGVLAKATNSADEILKENNITIEEFFKNWDSSKAVSDFEAGNITPAEFSEVRGNELDMDLKPNAVMNILMARKSVLYDGVEQLLDNLYKRNFVLACLSNTNVLHWNNIEGEEIFERYFYMKFLSYEMGFIKPQKEIYQAVLKTLQCKAHEILYFDDSKKNIDAALNLSFNAVHVKDFYDLAEKIDKVLSVKII
ncbi:HAD-IA family hydrolase [Anaerocolumna sp. MB42-C2]|uniref:HAD-IA family hydrolase n=1 Tax=Anaerocolumna sp. MB42-C2 TaxID=3070997 RepID=UPI0027E176C1|nr:HAD-IA family hydrolase [Anaerocolumna sp. MB42-C2]WMJ86800.1 HAD-IA family hydrolase [Anaerocolumna sp. MB42-C2]